MKMVPELLMQGSNLMVLGIFPGRKGISLACSGVNGGSVFASG